MPPDEETGSTEYVALGPAGAAVESRARAVVSSQTLPSSPLQGAGRYLRRVIDECAAACTGQPPQHHIEQVIRVVCRGLGYPNAVVVEHEPVTCRPYPPSTTFDHLGEVLDAIAPRLADRNFLRAKLAFGSEFEVTGTGWSRQVLALPLTLNNFTQADFTPASHTLILIADPRNAAMSVTPDELVLRILAGVICTTLSNGTFDAEVAERGVIDYLKRCYRTIPVTLVDRRFTLLGHELEQLRVVYHPVFQLAPGRQPRIAGWEALARRPGEVAAPLDFFPTLETWGPRFVIELDMHMVQLAVRRFWGELERISAPETKHWQLSVNVYADTLQEVPFHTALDKLGADGYPLGRLVLEILERAPFRYRPDHPGHEAAENDTDPEVRSLAGVVNRLRQRFGVEFALDDFGIDFSSINRMLAVRPDFVKLDREIVTHPNNATTLTYVGRTAESSGMIGRVIAEGVDDVRYLRPLLANRITRIQGHLFAPTASDPYLLTPEQADRINRLLPAEWRAP